jgi:hypothetical protein
MKKLIISIQIAIVLILSIKVIDLVLKKEEMARCKQIQSWIIEDAVVNPVVPEWCK